MATHRLELENVELSALLGIIDPLDETVVTLLESVHLVCALLLHQGRLHLLLSHLLSFRLLAILAVLTSFLGIFSLFLLSFLDCLLALLLLGLNCFNELLLLELLGLNVLIFGRLLVLLNINTQSQVVIVLLLRLGHVGTVRGQDTLEDLHGGLLSLESLAEILVSEVGLGERLVAAGSLNVVLAKHRNVLGKRHLVRIDGGRDLLDLLVHQTEVEVN